MKSCCETPAQRQARKTSRAKLIACVVLVGSIGLVAAITQTRGERTAPRSPAAMPARP